jgi:hypothetical protein
MLSKYSALVAYVFAIAEGLNGNEIMKDDVEVVMRRFMLVFVAPALAILTFYVFLGGTFIFSIMFAPIAICLCGPAVVFFYLLRFIKEGSMHSYFIVFPKLIQNRMWCYKETEVTEEPLSRKVRSNSLDNDPELGKGKDMSKVSSRSSHAPTKTSKSFHATAKGATPIGVTNVVMSQGLELNLLAVFRGSLWWLPDSLMEIANEATNEVLSFRKIVFTASVLVVLAPTIVLGCWSAYFTYQSNGAGADYASLAYLHFFSIVDDLQVRVPDLIWSAELDFAGWKKALPNFAQEPPTIMLEYSIVLSRLATMVAFIRPVASFFSSYLATVKMVGMLAQADSGFIGLLEVYLKDGTREELMGKLKRKGFTTTGFKFSGNEASTLEELIIHQSDTGKVVGQLLETLSLFTHLKVVNIKGCTGVTSQVEPLALLRDLKQLNLKGCKQIKGDVVVFKSLVCLTDVNLSDCEAISGNLAAFGRCVVLKKIDLGGCKGITGSVRTLIALKNTLKEVDLSLCSQLNGDLENLRRNLPACLITF